MQIAALRNRHPLTQVRIRRTCVLPKDYLISFCLATAFCLAIAGNLNVQFISPNFRHWFILPVVLCGGLIGADAIRWFRGRMDIFDPVGIIGIFGVHFFFLAQLLHVSWNQWMRYVTPPLDWRPWLGYMAILNFFGILMYRHVVRFVLQHPNRSKPKKTWRINHRVFNVVLAAALSISLVAQIFVYWKFEGISGYISSYEAREGAFRGMGWIFMVSESFPILIMLGFTVYARRIGITSWVGVILSLCSVLVLALLFGGLRGSRSNTVWTLFWAVGMIHFWIRPLSRKMIVIGVVFLVVFMYFYGFYKASGPEGIRIAMDPLGRADLENTSGRTLKTTLLGDLGRADIQAFLLYRLVTESDYDVAWGRTYVGAISVLIPRALWPERPPTKVKEGTEAQYGRGTWTPRVFQSSKVYGLAGEAMLNFGWLAVPFAYSLLAYLVVKVKIIHERMDRHDLRQLLYPFLVSLCIVVLVGDSDNIVYFVMAKGIIPFTVLWMSKKVIIPAGY